MREGEGVLQVDLRKMAAYEASKLGPSIVGLALTPVFFVVIFLLNVYRLIGHLTLKLVDPCYVALLDTLEAFFDRERGGSYSIINVLCRVKLNTEQDLRKSAINLAEKMLSNPKYTKLSCSIERWLGISYWRKVASIDFEKQICWFNGSNENAVRDYLCKIANEPINGRMMWEAYVSRVPFEGQHFVIVRFHHSVGDGYALREMAIEADPSYMSPPEWIGKSNFFIDGYKAVRNHSYLFLDVIKLFISAPKLCIEQYLSPKDRNSLRHDVLMGSKILRWRKGDFSKIKEIRKATGSTVTEILMCAISQGLDDLFKSRGESVRDITITYPARLSQTASNGLANEFLPVSLKLPINTLNRRRDVKAAVTSLLNTPAYKCNFQLPRLVAVLWPMELPLWTYEATEATCLFSNFPGPKRKLNFEGFEIEDFCFFLPNLHKNNGLGITVSSYVDHLNFTVILDEKLSRNNEDAQKLVDRIVNYIDDVYQNI